MPNTFAGRHSSLHSRVDALQFKDEFEKAQKSNAELAGGAPEVKKEETPAPAAEEKKEEEPAAAEETKEEEPKAEEKAEEEKKEE